MPMRSPKPSNYWFRARRLGRGWGLPCSWQGWAFFIPWLALLAISGVKLLPDQPFAFTMALAFMTLILVLVCYWKGEPLSAAERETG